MNDRDVRVATARLDTHLRVSATCKDIVSLYQLLKPTWYGRLVPRPTQRHLLPALPLTPPRFYASLPTTATTIHAFKCSLRLPKSADEWAEVDCLLLAQVVPAVMQAGSAEEKNSILCNLTYNIMAEHFGTKPLPQAQKSQRKKMKHNDRAL